MGTVRGRRKSVNGGNGQILGSAWGPHVMHAGSQGHGTGGLPRFQAAGQGRGASLLLARSKAAWRPAVSNLLRSILPWELLFPSNGCFYLHLLCSQRANVWEQYFLFICRNWYTWTFDSNLLWYSNNKILKLLCLLC